MSDLSDQPQPVLKVTRLNTRFKTRSGDVHAVNSVSFELRPGELLGVVGESGSGKSVTMMSLLGLLPSPPAVVQGDAVMFDGIDLLRCSSNQLRSVRGGRIGFIFQDPMTSLNPVFTVGYQIMAPLREHMGLNREAALARARTADSGWHSGRRTSPQRLSAPVLGLSPIMVAAALGIAGAIIIESSLSFLGLGFPPDFPTWGRLLFDAVDQLQLYPNRVMLPGIAISLTVLSVNYVGDGLRDALDPRIRGR